MLTNDRAAALDALLALPDPPDLQPRRHVWTQTGKPERYAQWRGLGDAWVQQQLTDRDECVEVFVLRMCDGPLVMWVEVAVNRQP